MDTQPTQPIQPPLSPTPPQPVQPTQPAAPTQAAPQVNPSSIQTPVRYTIGMLGKSTDGVLSFDGVSVVQLVDTTTNTIVFSKQLSELGRVSRAEWALYLTVPGISKKVAVLFGNDKRYIVENGAMMPFGIAGAIGGVLRSNQLNQRSGLETWVALFKANNMINNFSPNMAVVASIVIGIIIVVVSFVVSL